MSQDKNIGSGQIEERGVGSEAAIKTLKQQRAERIFEWLETPAGKWYVARAREGQPVVFYEEDYDLIMGPTVLRVELDVESVGYRVQIAVTESSRLAWPMEVVCESATSIQEHLPLECLKRIDAVQTVGGKLVFLPEHVLPRRFHWSRSASTLPVALPFWGDDSAPGLSADLLEVLSWGRNTDFFEWQGELFTRPAVRTEICRKLAETFEKPQMWGTGIANGICSSHILDPRIRGKGTYPFTICCAILSLLLGESPERLTSRFGTRVLRDLVDSRASDKYKTTICAFSPRVWLRLKRHYWPIDRLEETADPEPVESKEVAYAPKLRPVFRLLRFVGANDSFKKFWDAYVEEHGPGPWMEPGEHCDDCCDVHGEMVEENSLAKEFGMATIGKEEDCQGCCGRWEVGTAVGTIEFFSEPYIECQKCERARGPAWDDELPSGCSRRLALYECATEDLESALAAVLALCEHQEFSLELRRAILTDWRDAYDTCGGHEAVGMLLLIARVNGATDREMHDAYHRILTRRDRSAFGDVESDTWRSDPVYKAAYDWMVAQGWPILWDECL
jgi:hypothetical protein